MTPALRKYVDLERIMLELEAVDEGAAEAVREVMDGLWYALSAQEHSLLDERNAGGPIRVLESVRLPAGTAILQKPSVASARPYDGKPVSGWRKVA